MSDQHSVIVSLEAAGDLRAHCRSCTWRGPLHSRQRTDPSEPTALKAAQRDAGQHRLETRASEKA